MSLPLIWSNVLTRVRVCGNTFYHTGSILLLRTGQVWPRAMGTGSERVGVSAGLTLIPSMLMCKDEHVLACSRALWHFYFKSVAVGLSSGCH